MTISSTTRIAGPYTGSGTTGPFTFAFKVFQASDLVVVKREISTATDTTLTLTTDYSVTLNGNQNSSPGGSITLVSSISSAYELTLTSSISNLQPTDLTNQGGFYPEVITDALDRACIQIQQLASLNTRSLVAPISDGLSTSLALPAADLRANKYLAFDANGVPMAADGTDTPNITSAGNMTITANNAGSNVARDVIFYDNATETMRIKGSGATSKVGIGASSPSQKLDVNGQITSNRTTAGEYTTLGDGVYSFGDFSKQYVYGTPGNSGFIGLYTTNSSGTTSHRLIANENGIGIGALSPVSRLHVHEAATSTATDIRLTSAVTGATSSDGVSLRLDTSGNSSLWNYENTSLLFATNNSEKVRIDSSGNVGIGTTSPSTVLHVKGSAAAGHVRIETTGDIGSGSACYAGFYGTAGRCAYLGFGGTSNALDIWNDAAGVTRFATNNTERMRILAAGQLCVNTTTALSTTNRVNVVYPGGTTEFGMGFRPVTTTTTTATTAITFEQSNGSSLGSISHPTTGGTVYNTTSDYRLKTNVTPMSNTLDRIDDLKPCNYTWIDSGIASEGFIAHELQEVIPQAVTGIKDDVDEHGNIRPQGVDYSRVVPTLTAAIKELKAIVEAQALRIAALEANA
jgi:hypothetical protein